MEELLIAFLEDYMGSLSTQTTKIADDFELMPSIITDLPTESFEAANGWTQNLSANVQATYSATWKTQGTNSLKISMTGANAITNTYIEKTFDARGYKYALIDLNCSLPNCQTRTLEVYDNGVLYSTYAIPTGAITTDMYIPLPQSTTTKIKIYLSTGFAVQTSEYLYIDNLRFIKCREIWAAKPVSTGNIQAWKEINFTKTLGGNAQIACHVCKNEVFASGTAQAGAATTITLASGASAIDDYYNGKYIVLKTGIGAGQVRKILDYVGSTKVATVGAWVDYNPGATTTYEIYTPLIEDFAGGDASVIDASLYQSVILLFVGTRTTTTSADTASLSALTATWGGVLSTIKSRQSGTAGAAGNITISQVNPDKCLLIAQGNSYIVNDTTIYIAGAYPWQLIEQY